MNNYINFLSTLGLIFIFCLLGNQSFAQIVAEPYPYPCGGYAEYRTDASEVGTVTRSNDKSEYRKQIQNNMELIGGL